MILIRKVMMKRYLYMLPFILSLTKLQAQEIVSQIESSFSTSNTPPQKDLGVTIYYPNTGYLSGTTTPVFVTLNNFGTATQTNTNLITTINGTIVSNFPWTGSLSPGMGINVLLPLISVPPAAFQLCVYSVLSGDTIHSNDTSCFDMFGFSNFILPFTDNFEGALEWHAVADTPSVSNWQLGTPNYGSTTGAFSGTNAWDIDLQSGYTNKAMCYLYSPYFDFTGIVNPVLSFWQNFDTQKDFDGVLLQYAINYSTTWNDLGVINDPNGTNWHNSYYSGSAWSGTSYGWKESTYDLVNEASIANQPSVQFRFRFYSDILTTGSGYSIDDFAITIPDSNDIGISAIVNPLGTLLAGTMETVIVTLKNFGTVPQTSAQIYYQVGSNPVVGPHSWTGNILPGQKINILLSIPFMVPLDTFNLCAWTSLSGDSNSSNDSLCIQNFGQTIIQINQQGFIDNFENGNLGWQNNSINVGTSWEFGTPAWHSITSAYSPVNAWMTNHSSGYDDLAFCTLTSPYFDFSQQDSIVLSFRQKFSVENSYDGTRLEYSTDNGLNWLTLGTGGQFNPDPHGINWYNDDFISSSGVAPNQFPGWTNNSSSISAFPNSGAINGWMQSKYQLVSTGFGINGLINQVNPVRFRFVFTSDFSVNAKSDTLLSGYAIDNFSLQPACNIDAGITSIYQPSTGFPQGTSQIPQVTFQNNGLPTINNCQITYCVTPQNNGITTCTSYNWSGILPHTAITSVNLAPFVTPVGLFDFCVKVSLTNDCDSSNDSVCTSLLGVPIYILSNGKFNDSFDNANKGWLEVNYPWNSALTNWELGTPDYGVTTGAHSPPNAWDINLDTSYFGNAACYLYSPYFDLTNPNNDTLSFWHNYVTDFQYDGLRMEYAINNNGFWSVLGIVNDPKGVNWYNSTLSGTSKPAWSGSSGGWIQSKYGLASPISGSSIVQFRYVFLSNNNISKDGYSIDDFSIHRELPFDAGIVSTNIPSNMVLFGNPLDLKINLKNYGYNSTNPINVYYSLNGSAFINNSWIASIASDSSVIFSLGQITPVGGTNSMRIYIVMTGDPNQTNDTLDFTFNANILATPPYSEAFETANSGWTAIPSAIGATSWEWGSPSFGLTNSVHSGSFCWDINLAIPYGSFVNTKLLSPVFNYSFLNPSELRCWMNYNTEINADGVRLNYSFDGINFLPLGVYNDPNGVNWYNTALVTALNGAGWCGNSSGWQEVVYNTSSFFGQPFVQYRFDFRSDPSLAADGFSLDDFVINATVGIKEQDAASFIKVYPNPVKDKLNIVFTKEIGSQVIITLLDITGAIVRQQSMNMINNKTAIDLNNVIDGIYIMQINTGENVYHRKITKVK